MRAIIWQGTESMTVDNVQEPKVAPGTVVLIGLHEALSSFGFHNLIRSQINLRGSFAYTAEDFGTVVERLVSGGAGLEKLSPLRPLEDGPGIFSELVMGPSEELKVFLGGGARR